MWTLYDIAMTFQSHRPSQNTRQIDLIIILPFHLNPNQLQIADWSTIVLLPKGDPPTNAHKMSNGNATTQPIEIIMLSFINYSQIVIVCFALTNHLSLGWNRIFNPNVICVPKSKSTEAACSIACWFWTTSRTTTSSICTRVIGKLALETSCPR